MYGQTIFSKDVKTIQWRERIIFWTNDVEKLDNHMQKMLDPYLMLFIELNSKLIKY